ncbi:MAG: hypothetical protein HUU25_01250 [Candidatus Sumerlaeia bacterium]|nr:hypothetical protein [Candidatus Sumerlaeia bacterium]
MPRLPAVICAAVGALCLGPRAHSQPVDLEPGLLQDVSQPQVAAGPGGEVHLVHLGEFAGGMAVAHRAWSGGRWGDEEIVSASGGSLFDPQVTVSADGTVHVVWSTESPAHVLHAFLRDGVWSVPANLSEGLPGASEFPSLAARPSGAVDVVWQTLAGTQFQVVHAEVAPSGRRVTMAPISAQNPRAANRYPQVFSSPVPIVAWYEAVDGDLMLRVAEQIPGNEWRLLPVIDLLQVDLNRLPYLLLSDLGTWAALWHDAAPHHDRVLFGRGGPPGFGLGVAVDSNPEVDNVAPCATSLGDDLWAIAWRAEESEGAEIYVAVESLDGWVQENLSRGMTPAAAQPAAVASGGLLHVVWVSDADAGGTGALVSTTVPME